MFELPPMPTWDALHPLIIHFPIALLLLSPLFVLIGAAVPPFRSRPFMTAGMIILLLGTASLFFAAATGEAAGELAERGGPVDKVLAAHQDLAEETRMIFLGLSAIFMGILFLPRLLHREQTRIFSTVLPLAFLALYSVGVLFLVNTAHQGGRLVHEYGVHALLPEEASQQQAPNVAAEGAMHENR
jgi:uncharacterized membrane protein